MAQIKKITKIYQIYKQSGEPYERISITGEDDEDCAEQLESYLDTKQDCYGFEAE